LVILDNKFNVFDKPDWGVKVIERRDDTFEGRTVVIAFWEREEEGEGKRVREWGFCFFVIEVIILEEGSALVGIVWREGRASCLDLIISAFLARIYKKSRFC
jgi:hypothetical protein